MGSELVAGEHMNAILASGADILSTPWGMAVFILFDIVVLVLIMALNYRWIFKRVLDILFSAVFLVVFFPFFLVFLLADAIYNKTQNAYRTLFTTEYYAGKKEKIIRVTTFSTERIVHDESGKLLPLEERITKMGKVLRACGMKYYPCLVSVFAGRMSFVGPRLMLVADACAVSDDAAERFAVRPGLVSSLEKFGGDALTYPDMFEEDTEYVRHIGFFKDIGYFCLKIINCIRGDAVRRYGECTDKNYIDWLLETDRIDEEEAKEYYATAKYRRQNVKEKRSDSDNRVQRSMLR